MPLYIWEARQAAPSGTHGSAALWSSPQRRWKHGAADTLSKARSQPSPTATTLSQTPKFCFKHLELCKKHWSENLYLISNAGSKVWARKEWFLVQKFSCEKSGGSGRINCWGWFNSICDWLPTAFGAGGENSCRQHWELPSSSSFFLDYEVGYA